jgi:hypothetical protein
LDEVREHNLRRKECPMVELSCEVRYLHFSMMNQRAQEILTDESHYKPLIIDHDLIVRGHKYVNASSMDYDEISNYFNQLHE